MYFTKESLRNPQLMDDFVGILLHELTHCAYTIKQKAVYQTETQIFCSMQQQFDGKVYVSGAHETYMEPIVNYISTRIH